MRKPSKAGIAVLGLLGLICTLALPGSDVSQLLFLSTFDLEGPSPKAELGEWVESSSVGGITLVPYSEGGQELRFDSNGLGGHVLYLTGLFEDGQMLDSGRIRLTLRMMMVDMISPFRVGLVVDNPTSDFVPATGPGADGMLWIDQQPTSSPLPVGEDLFFTVDVWRSTRFDDWSYSVSVSYGQSSSEAGSGGLKGSGYEQINGTGTVEDSMLLPIVGLKLEKPAANVGIVAVDHVKVMTVPAAN